MIFGAYSLVAKHLICNEESAVRFCLGPPNLICRRSCLGASPLGIGFRQEIPGGFEIRQKNSRRKSAVRADGNKKISRHRGIFLFRVGKQGLGKQGLSLLTGPWVSKDCPCLPQFLLT